MADESSTKERGISRSAMKIGAKLKGLQTANAELKRRAEAAESGMATLTDENKTLKAQVLTPDAKDKKIAELQGEIRTGKHKAKFAAAAKKAGASDDVVEDLWTLSGYKAETDEPDEQALETLIAEQKTRRPVLFGAKAGEQQQGQQAPPTPPGRGRGDSNQGGDGTIITAEQRADPKFMLNPANQDLILQAAKEHRFR